MCAKMMEDKYKMTTVDEDDDEECLRLLALKSLNTKKEFIVSTHRIKVVDSNSNSNSFKKYNTSEPYVPQAVNELDRWANTAEYASYVATRSDVEVNSRVIPPNVQLSPRSLAFVAQNNDALLRRKIDKSPAYRYRSPSPEYTSSPDRWSKSPSPISNYDLNHKRHKRSKSNSPPCTKKRTLSRTPPSSNNVRYSSRSPAAAHHYRGKRSRTPLSLSPGRSDKKNLFKRETSPHRRKPFARNTGPSSSPSSKSPMVRRSLSPKQENRKQQTTSNHKFQSNATNISRSPARSPVNRKVHDDHSKKRRYRSREEDSYKMKNDKPKRKERDRGYNIVDHTSRKRPETSRYTRSTTDNNHPASRGDHRSEQTTVIPDNITNSTTSEKKSVDAKPLKTDGPSTSNNAVKLSVAQQEMIEKTDSVLVNISTEKVSSDEEDKDEDEFEIDLFPSDESESENEGRFKLNVNKSNKNSATKQILSFRSLLDDASAAKSTTNDKAGGETSAAKQITNSKVQGNNRSHHKDDHGKKRDIVTRSSRTEHSNSSSSKKSVYSRLGAALNHKRSSGSKRK